MINLIKAEVARLLTEAGHPPLVLTAACHVGPDRARDLFEATYDDYRRRVGERWERMTPEQREQFREGMRGRCGSFGAPAASQPKTVA